MSNTLPGTHENGALHTRFGGYRQRRNRHFCNRAVDRQRSNCHDQWHRGRFWTAPSVTSPGRGEFFVKPPCLPTPIMRCRGHRAEIATSWAAPHPDDGPVPRGQSAAQRASAPRPGARPHANPAADRTGTRAPRELSAAPGARVVRLRPWMGRRTERGRGASAWRPPRRHSRTIRSTG